jgi:hypothetical protein
LTGKPRDYLSKNDYKKTAFDGFSFVKFYAKTTTSGIDIGYKEGLKKICESPHTIKEYGFTAKFIKVARLVI